MILADSADRDVAARARAWRNAAHAAVCDLLEPWAHGTVVRATGYPSYFDLNVVRVEDDPEMSAEALVAFADEALAGLGHRRVDFDLIDAPRHCEPLSRPRAGGPSGCSGCARRSRCHPDPTSPSRRFPTTPRTTSAFASYREEFPDQDPASYG